MEVYFGQCEAMELKGVKPILDLDMEIRWNSTYEMLKHALKYREVFTRLTTTQRDWRPYECSNADFAAAEEAVALLETFKFLTDISSKEGANAFRTVPAFVQILDHLSKVCPAISYLNDQDNCSHHL
jgi:hypothetical protein